MEIYASMLSKSCFSLSMNKLEAASKSRVKIDSSAYKASEVDLFTALCIQPGHEPFLEALPYVDLSFE